MKRFKKVLALVLAGVMALALLTACGETTDPDKIMPEDGTPEVVLTINQMAASKYLAQVDYSVKYSKITQELLDNWVKNKDNPVKYREEYARIVAELGGAKIVVGLTDNTIPQQSSGNPAATATAKTKYDTTIFGDPSSYELGDTIGVAFYKYTDTQTTFQLVCLFKTK